MENLGEYNFDKSAYKIAGAVFMTAQLSNYRRGKIKPPKKKNFFKNRGAINKRKSTI